MIFIIALLYLNGVFSSENWWEHPRYEAENEIFYVASSEGDLAIEVLKDQAFNRILSEIIREHFGFGFEIQESVLEDLKNNHIQFSLKQKSIPMFLKGITIIKSREEETNLGKRVYVMARLKKSDILNAQKISPSLENHLNRFGENSFDKVSVAIRTNPSEALIQLVHKNKKFSIQGQGDAIFFLPRGDYKMSIIRGGHETLTDEISVINNGLELNYKLKELYAEIELVGLPKGAIIEFSGQRIKSTDFKIKVGKKYSVKVYHPDFFDLIEEFRAEEPRKYIKYVHLSPRPSSISFKISPVDALLEVDNIPQKSNVVTVEAGERKVRISRPGFEEFNDVLDIVPNRDYPIKEVRLTPEVLTHKELGKSSLGLRVEYNPLISYNGDTLLMGLPLAVHLEKSIFSIGGGYNLVNDSVSSSNGIKKYKLVDQYLSLRIISKRIMNFNLYGSYTYGIYGYSKSFGNDLNYKTDATYQGPGLGLRMSLFSGLSLQSEFHLFSAHYDQTDQIKTDQRLLFGLGWDF